MKEMDLIKKPKIISSEFLSSVIPQLLLSVSIFSFVFSYSTSLSSSSWSLLYSPKFHYFYSNYFHLLKHALNKNCLFLICNGLLVFVAKTSGFVRPPSAYEINEMLQKRICGDCSSAQQTLLEAKLEPLLEKFVISQDVISNDDDQPKEDKEENDRDDGYGDGEKKLGNDDEGRNEVSIFIAESEEEDVKRCELSADESRKFWLFDEDDYVDDDDDDQEQLLYGEHDEEEEVSTEELNRKFEDFIRRMKKEIIINEARQKGGHKLAIMN